MRSNKQIAASNRNFNKMRVTGGISQLESFTYLTQWEKNHIARIQEELRVLLVNWDSNTEAVLETIINDV